jgi:hypothetical protein
LEEEEEVVRREQGGAKDGRREDPHLSYLILPYPDPKVIFPTLHDPLRFCKWWFLASYGRGLARTIRK